MLREDLPLALFALPRRDACTGSGLKLSTVQRRRLQRGDYTPLDFPYDAADPDHGRPRECCIILEWEPERRLWDATSSTVVTVPAQPLLWVEVSTVQRHRKGHWRAQINVTDLRQHTLYLGRGGAYTTSRFRAIDELEVVPARWQEQASKRAYERDRAVRLEKVAANRTDRWQRNRSRRKAIAGFRTAA